MHDTDVSIIIVNWNTRELLRDCIKSVYENTHDVSYEIIVVDNNSSDGSAAMVSESFGDVKLVCNSTNAGFAAANNQGMSEATGRYVLLLNSDTVVLESAIDRSVEWMDSHGGAAVMGCRVLNPDRSMQRTCFMFPSVLNCFLLTSYLSKLIGGGFFGREQMQSWRRDSEREVDVVTGCFMLVRSEAIEQIGMMDEDYFVYGEETDWCWRFKESGWDVVFSPVGEIVHYGGQSSRQSAGAMMLQLRGSILLFFRKHKSLFEYFAARFLIGMFFLLRAPFWAVGGLRGGSKGKESLVRSGYYFKASFFAIFRPGKLCVNRGEAVDG